MGTENVKITGPRRKASVYILQPRKYWQTNAASMARYQGQGLLVRAGDLSDLRVSGGIDKHNLVCRQAQDIGLGLIRAAAIGYAI